MTVTDVFRLGDLLRRVRLDAGLNQTELASRIGASQSQVSRWERGEDEPHVSELRKIAEATGADYLLDLRGLPSPWTLESADQAA